MPSLFDPTQREAVVRDLSRLLSSEQVSVAAAVLEAHGRDEAYPEVLPPDVVVFAHSSQDVVAVVRYAAQHRIPLTPFSVGSSLEGNALARFGGICLDTSRMDRILDLRPPDLYAVVQPGLTYPKLNAAARPHGLFMPVDPGAEASLGGMAATGASGTNAVRYGTMKDFVMALEVVLPSGEVIRTGSKARKSSSGLDLTKLLVGSEGTLGIFTELTIRLVGLPSAVLGAVVTFPSIDAAVQSAVAVIQAGIPVARIELVDPPTIRAVNAYKGLTLKVAPTLFLEFHGNEAGVRQDAAFTEEICRTQGGEGFAGSLDPEERKRLWEARHHAYYAMRAAYPGRASFSTDVAVPISKLPECIAHAQGLLEEYRLDGTIIGHVGDGNFHTLILYDAADPEQYARAEAINGAIITRGIELGGTATGEHGVGIRKRKYMQLEHGPALMAMRAIKTSLDPLGIMNPGKLVDGLESWQSD
jgi:D-lactate dehydrogenase (cytochrome)